MDAILHRRGPSGWERFIRSPSLFIAHKTYESYLKRSLSKTILPKSPIRVVCISDTHNQHESISPLPDGDILIHAGDLTQSGTTEELKRALTWLSTQPQSHKLFIAGNHDSAMADSVTADMVREEYPSLVYLQDSATTVTVRGRVLSIYGSPHTPRHGSWPAFVYPRIHSTQAQSSTQWSSIPLQTDVIITHGPPAHHLDDRGRGCIALLQTLWRVRPRLHVFGHVHVARGIQRVRWSEVQNVYERICTRGGGWWDLLVMLALFVKQWWTRGDVHDGPETILVNAAVTGGFRDELRRKAIVVDI